MQTLTKLDLPTLRKGITEERTQRNKWKIWHSLGIEPRSSACLAPMLYPLSYGCQWADLNFCPNKHSNLKFTPLPTLHVDFYSRHVDNSVLFFHHNCPMVIPLQNTAVLIKICRFLINVVKLMQTLTKLDIPTFHNVSTEESTQRSKWKIWHSLGLGPWSSACLAPMPYPLSYGCQWADLYFCPNKHSNLKFTPLPTLHVDFYSRHVDNSVLFFHHTCPLVIPLQNTAVLIKICRFLINVVKLMQTLTKLDIPTFHNVSTEESTQRSKWKIWHSLGLEPRSPAFLAPMP